MTIADRIRVQNVRVLSDNHYTLKTTTLEWRRANGAWQTQHRETYDRGALTSLHTRRNDASRTPQVQSDRRD